MRGQEYARLLFVMPQERAGGAAMTRDDLRFQRLYEEYNARICRYLARMVGEKDAEDLTQEVFMKVGRSLEGFRGDSGIHTWIYRIATNTALDWLRRGNASHEEDEDAIEGFPSETGGEDRRVVRQEMSGCIRTVVDGLPESYRSIILLSEFEEMRDCEVAEILGISLEAAKIRLHRARSRLREELKKACVLYHDERNELACDRKPRRAGDGTLP